jgi:hypothetical protein
MSLDTVEGLAAELQGQHGISRDAALRAARAHFGAKAPDSPAEIARDDKILEKAEQAAIVKLFRAYGLTVYNLSQARPSKQAPGLPDLWCMRARDKWGNFGAAFWWESKRQVGGERSAAQIAFGELSAATNVPRLYGFGDRYDAAKFLVTIGLAVEDRNGEYGIRPALIGRK